MKKQPWLWAVLALVAAGLACATNTPVAQVPPARPTRTPLPTFTPTPLPVTATATLTPAPGAAVEAAPAADEPAPTNTPVPPTATPAPSETPVPPTNTPVPPTNTPVPPTNTPPPPPTATFTPPPTPTPPAVSVVATPTPPPQPDTPPGRYEIRSTDEENNCAHVAVVGKVVEKGSDRPVQYVTIQVKGDEDPYKGPFVGKSNENGDYTVLIGVLKEDIDGVDFEVEVIGGANVKSEDDWEWKAGDDCGDSSGDIQIMEIDWFKKD